MTPRKADPLVIPGPEPLNQSNKGKDKEPGGQHVCDLYVRKHYNVPVVRLLNRGSSVGAGDRGTFTVSHVLW